jgi:phosphohistidine phosphatase SixA
MAFRVSGPSSTLRSLAILPLFLFIAAQASAQSDADSKGLANEEILIVRHAERDGAKDALTPDGVDRANAYAKYFKDLSIDGRTIHLTHVIAEKSQRTRLTMEPLSKAIGLPLDTRFATKEAAAMVDDLKHHSYGGEVLICWHHSKMPNLIRALGGNPNKLLPDGMWPDTTYDWIIDLRYDANGHLLATGQKCIHEHLMPGDRP